MFETQLEAGGGLRPKQIPVAKQAARDLLTSDNAVCKKICSTFKMPV